MLFILISFFRIFVPLIAEEAQKFSGTDSKNFINALQGPIQNFDKVINETGFTKNNHFSLLTLLTEKINSVLNVGFFSEIFGSIASTAGNVLIGMFSVVFITFFFLKDEHLFGEAIVLLTPTIHENATRSILIETKNLLMRYFIGIAGQITCIMILLTIGLSIVGINLKTCLVIAFFAGLVNIIPYIGPLIGISFGLILGLASKIQFILPDQILPFFLYIMLVFVIVHLIDNTIFQPFILSSSVKAHPLEIFLIILIAGHLAGIIGMLVAIPSYTVIRVFAKEFLNNFKVVKKLTEKI